MTQLVRYKDATESPDQRVEFPEVVAELEGLGFTRLGRIVIDIDEAEASGIAAGYTPEDRAAFMEHWDVPMPVLASRDGTAFADVSWWWGGPSIRIRTELSDGSLVETNRTWDNEPGLPGMLRFLWRRFDIDREMTRASVPARGRSTQIRPGPDTAALWQAHRDHVAAYSSRRGAAVSKHRELEAYMRIATQAVGHEEKVMRIVSKLWIRAILAWGVLAIGLALALAFSGATAPALRVAIAGILLTPVVLYLVPSRLRWLPQSWRPKYP